MFTIKYGDVFDELKAGDIFVHGCNAQGVMGSDIAKIVKERFPEVYQEYKNCPFNNILGSITCKKIDNILYINAVTQKYYGRDVTKVYVDYDIVKTVMMEIITIAIEFGYNRVVFPFIGSGLANGNREVLLDIFRSLFDTASTSTVEGILVINN